MQHTLSHLLEQLYKPDEVTKILNVITPLCSQKIYQNKEKDWHKNITMYSVYPDAFCKGDNCTLQQLTDHLVEIKSLGSDAIHVLPPFESPGIDNGFDVSNYTKVRQELGGNNALDELITKASDMELTVFLDLILNHVSDQHHWFQNALQGDEYYRSFFFHSSTEPLFIETKIEAQDTFAYYEINGKKTKIDVIFPEQAGEIPHWVKQSDGFWYYHTFYPQQIDLNWHNPNVFVEYAKILIYWAQKSVGFRLDAIPYVGKVWADGMKPNTTATHVIVQSLRHILENVNPHSVFLIEANMPLEHLTEYCGTAEHKETDLVYSFQLSESIWIALMLGDVSFLEKTLRNLQKIPEWTQWVTFLRNHDELTLKYCDEGDQGALCSRLLRSGLPFKQGHSTAGRTASFLQSDPQWITLAYFFLASMPGNPSIMYGDEYGKENDLEFMDRRFAQKTQLHPNLHFEKDTRDINRGHINKELIQSNKAQQIYSEISRIFNERKKYKHFFCPANIHNFELITEKVFTVTYLNTNQQLKAYINFGEANQEIDIQPGAGILFIINGAQCVNNQCSLPMHSGIWLRH